MNNNILRTAKVKSNTKITQACEHNFRIREQHNIDSSKSNQNKTLFNSLRVDVAKSSDLQEKLKSYYDGLGIKARQDNVLMMEFVVSASPEYFNGKSVNEINTWANSQTEFFEKKFGQQLKIGVLHLDEKTPHIHFMIGTEFKSIKRYKNQKGEFFKETWSLNAKRYDKQFLIELHTEHAEHNKKFGLKRGVKGSMRNHTQLKEFYATVNKAMSTDYQKQINRTVESLETGLLSGKVSIEEVKEKFSPMMNKVLKQNKVLKEKFALDIKSWAERLSNKEMELEKKEQELIEKEQKIRDRRDVYVSAINRAIADGQLIKELQEENKQISNELEKYKPKENRQQLDVGRSITPKYK